MHINIEINIEILFCIKCMYIFYFSICSEPVNMIKFGGNWNDINVECTDIQNHFSLTPIWPWCTH